MKITFTEDNRIKRQGTNKNMKNIFLILGTIFLMFFLVSQVSATYQTTYNPAFSPTSTNYNVGNILSIIGNNQCSPSQDFILQINPTGCEDTPVRSDLLADQNVPVFCPVIATKINPLINVNDINSITFTGNFPPGVEGVTFVPYRAALSPATITSTGVSLQTGLTQQQIGGNIGYVVIVLKQQANESAIPKWINGTLTAHMNYNIQNAFGVGQVNYYLPDTTDQQWAQNYNSYSFWGGRGFLRATGITGNSATISVYSSTNVPNTPGNQKVLVSQSTLNVGQTSSSIPISGFSYCFGNMNVKLNGLQNPDTMAKLDVNGNTLELPAGQSFINGQCKLNSVSAQGIVSTASISCQTDTGNVNLPPLTISPQINLSVNGAPSKAYSVGDLLSATSDPSEFVYLGYIGRDSSGNLFIVPVVSPAQSSAAFKQTTIYNALPAAMQYMSWNSGSKSENLLKSVLGTLAGSLGSSTSWLVAGTAPLGTITQASNGGKGTFNSFNNIAVLSETINNLFSSGNVQDIVNNININGLVGPQDVPLSGDSKTYYDNAIKDYQSVIASYSQASYPDGNPVTFGEETLAHEAQFSYDMGQKATAQQLCKQLSNSYPDSQLIPNFCSNLDALASPTTSSQSVNINGQTYDISLEDVIQPTLSDYGVNITINQPGQPTLYAQLSKNQRYYISSTDYISLTGLTANSATFDISGVTPPALQQYTIASSSITAQLNGPYQTFGKNKYTLAVTGINLHQLASVTVQPNINYMNTNASFPFNIGVEKRAISLTPNQTRSLMNSTTDKIQKWTSISNQLGTVVTDMQDTCQAVGAYLTIKNFISDLSGEGLARAKVMSGPNGWAQKCADAVKNKKDPDTGAPATYTSVDACLIAHSSEIDNAVTVYQNAMNSQDQTYKNIQSQPGVSSSSNFLGQTVVDNSKVLAATVTSTATSAVASEASSAGLSTIKIKGQNVPVSEIMNAVSPTNIDVTTWRDIQLESSLLGSSDKTVSQTALSALQSDLGTWYGNNEAATQVTKQAQSLGVDPSKVTQVGSPNTKTEPYLGLTYNDIQNKVSLSGVAPSTPIAILQNRNTGLLYYAVLASVQGGYGISKIYDQTGSLAYDASKTTTPSSTTSGTQKSTPNNNLLTTLGLEGVEFKVNPYQNQIINPEVSYYNTGPYAGLPAVIPFDPKDGWYAYIQSVLPTGSSSNSITPYDKSGRVSTLYLCNVGSVGIVQGPSGDSCVQENLATGQAYTNFGGLSQAQTNQYIQCAVSAVQQASQKYKSGVSSISISTSCGGSVSLKVGAPSIGTPAIQCEDFMSPSDCSLLFNVCDPVVCPTSRCNLGGAYPVSNVVQSGIIGSVALCYPNAKWQGGTDYLPVCVTGVKAGLDGYISMLKSFNSCLNTSLQTGQVVGICDEISAFYKCNFFWNDVYPLAKQGAISVLESSQGEHTSGGGEYLNVQNAISNAKSAANYFTQTYSAQSSQAFQARSTQSLQADVCSQYVSAVVPEASSIMNSLSAQASPPQYFGFFQSTPYTTDTNPPISEYKVFYHIYAGQYPAYYEVYLKGTQGSYYQDTAPTYQLAQGYIASGQSVDQTPDFTAPTGYNQLCINVNGQEDCNFNEVSTNFAANYLAQAYTANQASQNDITTTAGCSSTNGIVRVCATNSPGQGTDPNYGTTNAIWQPVGYCDTPNMKCWLNEQSVTSTITDQNLAQGALQTATANVQSYLSSNYIHPADFSGIVSAIQSLSDPLTIVNNITATLAKIYYPNETGYLTLLRGDTYAILAEDALLAARSGTSSSVTPCVNVTTGPVMTLPIPSGMTWGQYCTNAGSNYASCTPATCSANEAGTSTLCVNVTTGPAMTLPIPPGMTQEQYCTNAGSNYASCTPVACPVTNNQLTQETSTSGQFTASNSLKSAIANSDYSNLQYPLLNLNNIYYLYVDGNWYWSTDKDRWISSDLSSQFYVSDNTPVQAISTTTLNFNQQSSSNQALIKSLVGVSYGGGLNLLIGFEEKNGGGFIGIGGYPLSTEHVSMDSSGVFKVNIISSTSALQGYLFQYSNGQWILPQGNQVPEITNLLNSLAGKSFSEGAQILFSIDSAGAPSTATSTTTSGTGSTTGISCTTQSSCQIALGNQIMNIAQQVATKYSISDAQVQQDTGVKSFACLALLVSNLESGIQQCVTYQQNGNPLYCEGNPGQVLGGDSTQGGSFGAMQVNKAAQSNAFTSSNPNNAYNFNYNVNYALNLLAGDYTTIPRTYVCNSKTYSGWEAALRSYNGWTSSAAGCTSGNINYVEQVLGTNNKNQVNALFPQCA